MQGSGSSSDDNRPDFDVHEVQEHDPTSSPTEVDTTDASTVAESPHTLFKTPTVFLEELETIAPETSDPLHSVSYGRNRQGKPPGPIFSSYEVNNSHKHAEVCKKFGRSLASSIMSVPQWCEVQYDQ